MPGRSKKLIETWYGINPKNFEVERVSVTLSGLLAKWGKDGSYAAIPSSGDDPKREIAIVWALRDLICFKQGKSHAGNRSEKLCMLHERAVKMRKAAGKRSDTHRH